jgi:subtilase family serine protease
MRHLKRALLLTASTGAVAAATAASFTGPATRPAAKLRPAGDIFVPSGQSLPPGPLTSPPCNNLCYSPAQLKAAYDWPTDKHAPTGAGQTIVVAVAFGSPTIQADLDAFDAAFGLPPATVSFCGAPNTGSGIPPVDRMWGPEASAGIEYAHAMAPGANLVLLVAASDDFADMAAAEAQCMPQYPGAILLQSFGQDELDAADPAVAAAFKSLHDTYVAVTQGGGTVIAASGDFGATGIDCFFGLVPSPCTPTAEYPASDPLVTAVGGAEGNPYPDGLLQQVTIPGGGDGQPGNGHPEPPKPPKPEKPEKPGKNKRYALKDEVRTVYGAEQAWNESETPVGLVTGGAPSILFTTPDYQRGFNSSPTRTTSDVAYDAAGVGGEAIIWNGILGGFGGTSIGPAHWGALVALANELRASRHLDSIGQLNPALYAIASDPGKYARDFHDVTIGNNSEIDLAATGTRQQGFDAGPGYDLPTGLGTPDVANLIADLASASSKHDDEGDGEWQSKSWKADVPRGHNKLHVG